MDNTKIGKNFYLKNKTDECFGNILLNLVGRVQLESETQEQASGDWICKVISNRNFDIIDSNNNKINHFDSFNLTNEYFLDKDVHFIE